MRKLASVLVICLLFSMTVFAQTRTVSGVIKNDKGEAVPFATVTEMGTQNAVKADANGNFKISIKEKGQLSVSATGFTGKVVAVAGNNTTVILQDSPVKLLPLLETTQL